MSHITIIGSGIAGLFAALKIANSGHEVTIITKLRVKDSSTNWAQGGIAGILDKTDASGIESHIKDTLMSGDGLCDERIVRTVIESAADCINELVNEVNFETDELGDFRLRKRVATLQEGFCTLRMRPEKKSMSIKLAVKSIQESR